MARALSFEYLNRQLVWHELSELLLFLLPLLNVARLKSVVLSYLPLIVPSLQTSAAEGTAACTLHLYNVSDQCAAVRNYQCGLNSSKEAYCLHDYFTST